MKQQDQKQAHKHISTRRNMSPESTNIIKKQNKTIPTKKSEFITPNKPLYTLIEQPF